MALFKSTATGVPVAFNGATWVLAVADPGSGKQRQILAIHLENLDSVAHTFKGRKVVSAVGYEVYPALILAAGAKGQLIPGSVILENGATFEVSIEGAHTATAPRFDVALFEVP